LEVFVVNDWILVRVRRRERAIWLEYQDDGGDRWPSPDEAILGSPKGTRVEIELRGRPETVLMAPDLASRIRANLAELPRQRGPHATGVSPLPLFVARSETVAADEADAIVEAVLDTLDLLSGDALQIVRLTSDTWSPQRPFRLPLRVGWVGKEARAALAELKKAEWINDDVREFGLVIADSEAKRQSREPLDIVILGEGPRADEWVKSPSPPASHPRLLVALGSAASSLNTRSRPLLPPGLSVIDAGQAGPDERAGLVKSIAYGVVHDYPIHEVAASARRETKVPLIVYSDPMANQSLRLSDALVSMVEEARGVSDVLSFDETITTAVLDKVEKPAKTRLRAVPEKTKLPKKIDSELLQLAKHSALEAINMAQETAGLRPMAQVARSLQAVRPYVDAMRAAFREAWRSNPALREGSRDQRRVDIEILRRDLRDETLYVRKHRSMATSGRYRFRVQIGIPGPSSVMVGEVPAIAAFLPPADPERGHLLSIVLYGLDFRTASANAKRITLPPFGPSDAVLFDVMAPAREGIARARIAVYYELPDSLRKEENDTSGYHNQLVQSFLIEALVEKNERWHGSPVTTSRLEVSRRVAFEHLQTFTPRIASLGINESAPGTHTFMMKGRQGEGHVTVTDVMMQKALDAVRGELTALTDDGEGNPRFPETDTLERAGLRETQFDAAIRALGGAGSALHWSVWKNLPARQQSVLDDIKNSHDETVQILRYNPNYVFPWAALYDFAIPTDEDDDHPSEVCKGFLRRKRNEFIECGECLHDCLHPDKSEAYCVWGFWGMRHRVEQLLHAEGKEEASIEEVKPIREDLLRLTIGIDGPFAATLAHDLSELIGKKRVKEIVEPSDVVSTLWSDAERPAILVLLGHYENHKKFGPRIRDRKEKWLSWRELANRVKDSKAGKLSDPHPVVVLAACESAAAGLDQFVDFVNLFAEARVGAVIGTETVIFDGLAARLAKNVASSLTTPNGKLGQAVLDFRRAVLHLLNPLGLVVTPYGDADLHFAGV
jgi:hypothetical protein